jgi:RNA polymerase-binding transcription factor DksA
MMNLIAERLSRRWRLPWLRSSAANRPGREREQAHTAARMQPRQKAGLEQGADVLEEIWRAADRNTAIIRLSPCLGLVRRLRAMLTFLKTDVFGACLCCKATLGLSRLTAEPWTPLCRQCQEAANRDDVEILRIRSRSSRQRHRTSCGDVSKCDLGKRN